MRVLTGGGGGRIHCQQVPGRHPRPFGVSTRFDNCNDLKIVNKVAKRSSGEGEEQELVEERLPVATAVEAWLTGFPWMKNERNGRR